MYSSLFARNSAGYNGRNTYHTPYVRGAILTLGAYKYVHVVARARRRNAAGDWGQALYARLSRASMLFEII